MAASAFFSSCKKDDEKSASDFYIKGKVDSQLVNCEKDVTASINGFFGIYILQISMVDEGTSDSWTFQFQATEHPDSWTLPKTFTGDILNPFGDFVNGGVSLSAGAYGPLDPILCGMDWDFNLTVTKWEDNIVEGTFSGNMYTGDCDDTTPEILESAAVTDGEFKVKVP